jgi:transcriptional regulator with XRE-family HTH domain
MKQTELSLKTGLDKGAVSCYLSGKYEPKSDAINKMAIALNVNEMWLWGYDVPMEREKNTPEKLQLTEGEKMLLELFRQIPEEQQRVFLEMGRVYANSLKKD